MIKLIFIFSYKIKFYIFARMRKVVVFIIILLSSYLSAFSQYYMDYGVSIGASNYLGDIGGKEQTRRDFVADMKFQHTRWTVGGFFRYRFAPQFAAKLNLNYVRLNADDANSTNPYRRGRNLSFRNNMFELTANGELYIYKVNDVGRTGRYRTDFNLYLFGGAGLFYSNPQGELNGTWYNLQPLQTEGVAYKKLNFVIPAGLGFYYTMNRKYRLGMEVGWRTTFTDYIDDISTEYITHTDNLTASLANKNNQEVINSIEPVEGYPFPSTKSYEPGDKRGDPEHDDSYITATINFSMVLRGRSKFYRAKHSWILGRKKRKRRKSRAKF